MKIIVPLLLLLALLACRQPEPEKHASLQKLDWMIGEWVGNYQGEPFYESWRKISDSLLLNLHITVSPIDTSIRENGIIQLGENGITHSNEKLTWKLGELTETQVIFLGPNLPYANRIIWKHSPEDHWIADIENPDDSKLHYDLQRVDWLKHIVDGYMLASDKISQ